MKLITQNWISSAHEPSSSRAYSGASVAHARLIRAALHHQVADRVLIIKETSRSNLECLQSKPAKTVNRVHDLIDEFGSGRVSYISPNDIAPCLGDKSRSIILAAGPEMAHWLTLRGHIGLSDVPVCGIQHSVKWDICFATYTHTLVFSQIYDSLVATSLAGQRATTAILKYVEDNIARHTSEIARQHLDIPLMPLAGLEYSEDRIPKHVAREQLGFDQRDTLIVYLGRMSKSSKADLEPLLVAMQRLVAQRPITKLAIGGGDNNTGYCDEVRARVSAYKLDRNVAMLGVISPQEKLALLSAADIMVSPVDNIQETFGLSVVEAMGCGVPVVISSWSGYRDLITDGNEGFLVPTACDASCTVPISDYGILAPYISAEAAFADATIVDVEVLTRNLSELVNSPELRTKMGKRGMERAAHLYSSAALAKRLSSLWTKQLHKRDMWAAARKASRPLFAHSTIYRDYPDTWVRDDQLIAVADDFQAIESAMAIYSREASDTEFMDAAHAVIRACSEQALDVATLDLRFPGCRPIIIRLLKIGALVRCENHLGPSSRFVI